MAKNADEAWSTTMNLQGSIRALTFRVSRVNNILGKWDRAFAIEKIMNINSICNQIPFTAVRVEAHFEDHKRPATGLIFADEWHYRRESFLVTNRHVVEGCKRLSIMLNRMSNKTLEIGSRIDIDFEYIDPLWSHHPRKEIDVTVMPFEGLVIALQRRGSEPFFKVLQSSQIPNLEERSNLQAIEDVVIVGFPDGRYDCTNIVPIIRRGITATPISLDHGGLPAFLVDASVFPGSSGSPVFVYDRSGYKDGDAFVLGERLLFVGILSAGYFRESHGRMVKRAEALAKRRIPRLEEMIDLGFVFRAEMISEAVAHCKERYDDMFFGMMEIAGRKISRDSICRYKPWHPSLNMRIAIGEMLINNDTDCLSGMPEFDRIPQTDIN